MKTLIAIDGSESSLCAARTAAHLLSPIDRTIALLCVVPPAGKRHRGEVRRRYEEGIRAEARAMLAKAHAELPPGAGHIDLCSAAGSPATVIIARAAEFDLTVLGARSPNGETGLGPVASRVLEHSQGAVLIGRNLRQGRSSYRVLVAVDGSAASIGALETMKTAFDLETAEICLMHIVETPWVRFGLEEDWFTASEEEQEHGDSGEFERELTREGEAIIESARERLLNARVSISTSLAQGDPAEELLAEAERGEYDLVVTGATGARDLKHRMLGSVSTKVAWNAPCSVLVVREPEEVG